VCTLSLESFVFNKLVEPAQWITVSKLYFFNVLLLIADKSLEITVIFFKQASRVNLFKNSGRDASCKIASKRLNLAL